MTKIIIAIFIVVVLVGGGAAYYLSTSSNSKNVQSTNQQQLEDANVDGVAESGKLSGSFGDLLKLKENYTCTFDYSDDAGIATAGTVYVADEGTKFSGNFDVTMADGNVVNSNMVKDDEFTYVWTSALSQGYKLANPENSESLLPEDLDAAEDYMLDEDANMDFDCSPWKVDASKFELPTDIEFVDVSAMLQNLTNNSDVDVCAACEAIQDSSAKSQCLQALGC